MKITLDVPFTVGDLAPDVTYPHVYITCFFVNGPARTATITYEIGELRDVSDGNPMGTWNSAELVPNRVLSLQGAELYPFFGAQVNTETGSDPLLWDQVETLLYQLIQQRDERMAGALT